MRPRFHLALRLLALCSLTGCSETVTLGSECPDRSGPCPVGALDAGAGRGRRIRSDARVPSFDLPRPRFDASVFFPELVRDAGAPSGPAILPQLSNGSFELAEDGDTGAIAAISIQPGTASMPYWYTCQAFATENFVSMQASTETVLLEPDGGVSDTVLPQDGDAFVIAQPLVGIGPLVLPLMQQLEEPLRAGQSYAFALDVRTSGLLPASLRVRGANNETTCVQSDKLAESEPLLSSDWTSVCFTFTPKVDYTHLLLQANFEVVSNTSLYFDNLRSMVGCGD